MHAAIKIPPVIMILRNNKFKNKFNRIRRVLVGYLLLFLFSVYTRKT